MSKSEELRALREKVIPRGVGHVTPCVVDHAKGALLTDVDGEDWIDFSGGIGVVNVGHTPSTVVEAIQKQAAKLLHSCFHVSMYEDYIKLAQKMNEITPGDFEKKTMFINSGAEATENAIKIAKHYTKRPAVICFENAFHGRTYLGMSLTSKIVPFKAGFAPFAPEIYRIPFPYAYSLADGDQKKANEIVFESLQKGFKNLVDPESVAAIIFEPILGEGGFITADKDFFAGLREITKPHGIVTICDEVQSGFGRTGKLFAAEHFDIDYDLLASAKSIAAGMPLSAVTGKSEIMDSPNAGGLGGTYGGNPISCAAALAVIDMFENTDLLEVAEKNGALSEEYLNHFYDKYPQVGDVRGVGCMRAFEMVEDRASKKPGTDIAKKLAEYCHSQKLSLLTTGTYGSTVRLLFPINIEENLLRKGFEIIEDGLKKL